MLDLCSSYHPPARRARGPGNVLATQMAGDDPDPSLWTRSRRARKRAQRMFSEEVQQLQTFGGTGFGFTSALYIVNDCVPA